MVDDRPQQIDHVACLPGEANRRCHLSEPGVSFAEMGEGAQGPRLVTGCRPVVGQTRRPGRPRDSRTGAGLKRASQRGVQAHPLAGEQLTADRLGEQRMAEEVAIATRLGQQQLPVDRLAQAVQQRRLAHAGDRGQQQLGDAPAGRGGDAEHLLGAAAKPHHPGEQHLPQAGRQRARAGTGTVAGNHQLFGEERVALRAGVDVVDQPGGRVGAEQAGELLGQLGAGEAGQLQPLDPAVACQLAEQPAQRVQAVQLVAAEGQQQQHPHRAQVGGEEGDQVAGGAVRPVQVLHDQQQRRGRGQPLDHAQQQLKQPPLAGTSATSTHGRGRLGAPGEVGEQAAQVGTGRAGDRLQLRRVQLAGQAAQRRGDRRERQALLAERHAAAAQHPHVLPVGGGGELVGQPGLADPRLPADQRHPRLAVGGARQQLAQPRQLLGATDEAPAHHLIRHDAQYARPRF